MDVINTINYVVGEHFSDNIKNHIKYCYDTDNSGSIDIVDIANLLHIIVQTSWIVEWIVILFKSLAFGCWIKLPQTTSSIVRNKSMMNDKIIQI